MRKQCKNCKYPIEQFLSLGKMPLVNSFLKKNQICHEKKYDLSVAFCEKCYLVQLVKIVPPEDLFRNYIYFSSTSSSFIKHCQEVASYFQKRLKFNEKSLILELASNDGSFLKCFKDLGVNILGVDPARNIAKLANKQGIPTIPEFFGYKLAKQLKNKKHISADLIYGANVLAHVPQIIDFVRGVKAVLTPRGTAVFEFPYIKGLMEGKFDTIYHEHVFYYSALALRNLFKVVDMQIYDIKMTPMQGGSLMIFASHPGIFKDSARMMDLLLKEKRSRYDKLETYQKIGGKVEELKRSVVDFVKKVKKEGKTVAAYSAPAKGNVLLNYFNIGQDLSFIVDKSGVKQGLYTPGTHLLVNHPGKILKEKPDYLLILCWNIADEVIREWGIIKNYGGKFVIPIPNIKIIE